MPLSAQQLHQQYGELLQQPPFCNAASPYLLHIALSNRSPAIDVSMAAVKTWWQKYKQGQIELSVSSAKELQEKYGDIAKALAVNNSSGYLLVKALRDGEPAVYISDGVARQWLKQYFNLAQIENAGHLETRYGKPLRDHIEHHLLDAAGELFVKLCKLKFRMNESISRLLATNSY